MPTQLRAREAAVARAATALLTSRVRCGDDLDAALAAEQAAHNAVETAQESGELRQRGYGERVPLASTTSR